MKSRIITACIGCVLCVFLAGAVQAQETDEPAMIADILADADVPMSDEQKKQMSEFTLGGGPEVFRGMSELFNDEQTEALKEAFGTQPGFQGGPESPRFLFFAIIFENEDVPFTHGQLEQIKELPEGQGMFQEMQNIFSEEQSEILQEMMPR